MYNPSYHKTPEGAIALTENDIQDNKELFETILNNEVSNHPGVESLIVYLDTQTDFYLAPCSTVFHLNISGGLCLHSLMVYQYFEQLCDIFLPDFPFESVAICALLHDICKANAYRTALKSRKTGEYWPNGKAKWEDYIGYDYDDPFPYGHGEKSVYLITKHMQLTDEEALAIRWHMGAFDNAAKSDSRSLSKAASMYPVVTLLQAADMIATSKGF